MTLRCITFQPPRRAAEHTAGERGEGGDRGAVDEARPPEIVFMAGLASVIENFRPILQQLTDSFVVHYLETPEKPGGSLPSDADLSVPAMAAGVAAALESLGVNDDKFALVGYSLGATVILEAAPNLRRTPAAIVLVEPNAAFPFPRWALLLARWGAVVYRPIVPLLKWYIRTFRIDTTRDAELYQITCRILDAANPTRICAAVRALAAYRLADDLRHISVPSLVIGASDDTLHNFHDSRKIADSIPASRYIDLQNNRRSHGRQAADIVAQFIGSCRSAELSKRTAEAG